MPDKGQAGAGHGVSLNMVTTGSCIENMEGGALPDTSYSVHMQSAKTASAGVCLVLNLQNDFSEKESMTSTSGHEVVSQATGSSQALEEHP